MMWEWFSLHRRHQDGKFRLFVCEDFDGEVVLGNVEYGPFHIRRCGKDIEVVDRNGEVQWSSEGMKPRDDEGTL